jgi:predicted ArsR family transcriptional regulator
LGEIDQTVLLTVLKHGRITFRTLQKTNGISPRILRKHLDGLILRKLVHEEGSEEWVRGKKLWYILTEKGKKNCIRAALDDLSLSLNVIDDIAAQVSIDPERLKQWRDSAREAVRTVAKDDEIPLGKRIEQASRVRESYFGAFREALRSMHQISLRLFASRKTLEMIEKFHRGMYVLVSENGILNLVSEDDVVKHLDIPVTSI